MNTPYSKEELESYFAGFERMGEPSVRATINSDSWRNEQLRLGAAKEWIRRIDEAKQVPKTKLWHEKAWGKIVIIVIGGIIVAIISFYLLAYLKTNPQNNQTNNKASKMEAQNNKVP